MPRDSPFGIVISQDPPAETRLASGSNIHLIVQFIAATVPDLTGLNIQTAESRLEETLLTIRRARITQPSGGPRVVRGDDRLVVVSQDPPAGTAVPPTRASTSTSNFHEVPDV